MAVETAELIKNVQEIIYLLKDDFDKYNSVLDQIGTEIKKNSKHVEAYISFINNQLSNADTRKKGLILLRYFLPFCRSDVLEEHATVWLNYSLKNCKNESKLQDEAFKVIKPLLKCCYNVPDLNRFITSGTLSKIIENITKVSYNSNEAISALQCLETCSRLYPGSCLPCKNQIENFIISFVDCTSPKVILFAGRCFLALQQIGGGGTKGINHKENWKKQHVNICATIHSLLDELFESVMELNYTSEENVVPISLPKLPTGDKNKFILQRVINLITYLQEMLLGAFPVPKSVHPLAILNLITRGLSITRETFGEQIIEDALNMSSNLYTIHKHLLQLLQTLFACLGCDLIPYATQICKLVINNLKLTKTQNTINVKALSDLRIVAYKTLSLWVIITRGASCINTFSESVISTIIGDITPAVTELNLTVQNSAPKNLSKKAKRKIQHEQVTQSGVARNYSPVNKKIISSDDDHQKEICLESLNTLQTILTNCGYQLKPTIHKQLQEFIIKTLFNIQRGNILSPYDDIKCKTGLYKTLTSLVSSHHWNISPPTDYAVHLLSIGQSDSNPDIAFICSQAITNLSNFVHPRFATLQFPLDLDNLKNELNVENKKSTSPDLEVMESDSELSAAFSEEIDESLTENKLDVIEEISEVEESTTENNKNEIINVEETTENNKNEIINVEENTQNEEIINLEEEDDDMEPLIIEEDETVQTNKIEEQNNKKESPGKTSEDKSTNNEPMDVEEEDMLCSFVDIVND